MKARSQMLWTFAITSVALVMVTLDNLVVTTALPVLRRDLGATLQQLEWTVNAYTLTFAVLLLTGASLGDRFGRRRVFVLGLARAGLLGLVWGVMHGSERGWTDTQILGAIGAGVILVALFLAWEARTS